MDTEQNYEDLNDDQLKLKDIIEVCVNMAIDEYVELVDRLEYENDQLLLHGRTLIEKNKQLALENEQLKEVLEEVKHRGTYD